MLWASLAGALLISLLLSLVIGLFSLRVKAIFFAMITLAVASAFQTLASQLSDFTGGEDGLSFKRAGGADARFRAARRIRWACTLRRQAAFTYYLIFVRGRRCSSWLMLRIVNSPFGRVLQAIRENDFRAEALGLPHSGVPHVEQRAVGIVRHAGRRAAGALAALYGARHDSLSFEIMLDILLIVVIGGMGTMYGAVIGACFS